MAAKWGSHTFPKSAGFHGSAGMVPVKPHMHNTAPVKRLPAEPAQKLVKPPPVKKRP